ncbi:LacI family DNA-binding transcriptional regulator [Phytohalomonas tamaricis]|uniref:LacI family DNA-binding transcriptional regulator n=1 Tax=Phytohalomonas tamaricis TaxID=2081032 RepID=UPI000D0B3351|nr:LacI family DNA-binding transcriptional regulator [Phytohalomonas tamaricis]
MAERLKVRLEDVAQAANVSKITVSRAFTAPDKVHPDTREHILSVARELNYTSSNSTPSAKTPSTRTLGIVNPNMSNPFFSGITKEMTLTARACGFEVLMFDSYESEELESAAIARLIDYRVDAVILSVISSDAHYHPAYFEKLAKADIPVVLVDREINAPHHGGVYIDNLDCGYQAGAYMLRQGVKNVMVVSGPADSLVSIGRNSGIREAIGRNDTALDVYYTDFTMEPAYRQMSDYLSRHAPPAGIIGINNQITMGILKACYEHNVIPQRDTLVFGIDEMPYAEVFGLDLPCIHHDIKEIGQQAVDLALRAIETRASTGPRIIVRGTLQARD